MVARRVKSPWTEPPQLVPYGSAEVAVRAPARPAGTHASPAPDPGDFAVEAFAQGHGRIEEAQPRHGGVQVQLIARGAAREALVHVALQVGGEGAATPRGGVMYPTGSPNPWRGTKPTRSRTFLQGDESTDFGEADAFAEEAPRPCEDGAGGGIGCSARRLIRQD